MTLRIPIADVKPKVEEAILQRRDQCIKNARLKWQHDFFVIIQYLPKRKQQQGLQINIAALDTIPTPTYDTTLFKYHYKADDLELLWTLPAQEYALNLYHNRDKVQPSEYSLLEQVMRYFDGSLFNMITEWENRDDIAKRDREHTVRTRESKSGEFRGS